MINSWQTDVIDFFWNNDAKFLHKKMSVVKDRSNAKMVFSTTAAYSSRTFQVLSMNSSIFKYFKGTWIFKTKFKHFQGLLKHADRLRFYVPPDTKRSF